MIHAYLRNISSKKKTDTKNRLINVIKRAIMRSLSNTVTQEQRDETCIKSESVRYLSFYWSL